MRIIMTAITAVLLLTGAAPAADDSVPLTRDEVAVYKKKLVAVQAALGQPPAGYAKDRDEFNLPTEIVKVKGKDLYFLSSPNVRTSYSGDKLQKAAEQDIQKKMSEAMARGDYEAFNKAIAGGMQQEEKEPIDVTISFNNDNSRDIDPDGVIVEKPGVLAIITDAPEENRTSLMIFCDPVRLKNTKTLSRVSLAPSSDGMNDGTVAGKTVVRNVVITLTGPVEEVKAWAKKIDTAAVLKQIASK